MGSYNAKSITADDKEQRIQPASSWKQIDSKNPHPFTIEDTSDTDGEESAQSTNSQKEASVKQSQTPSVTVMQDEQQQPELAKERHREESRGPSGSSGESVSPYGIYNPLAVSDGGRPFPVASVASAVAGSGLNPGTLPLIQYPGQPAPPLVAITPTSTAVFAPYASAFTSPAVGIYSNLHSNTPTRQYHGAVESYSAMLANMGNQAQQQHLQGHLIPAPSYFQAGYIPAQYTPVSPLMAGVVPTSKGMFSEGGYLPTAVGPTVLTGILPGSTLNPTLGSHGDAPSGDRGRTSPDKHYTPSARYLSEARERELLESRQIAEMQQMSPSGQVHRSIPEARVSPFQQVSMAYRVAVPETSDHPDSKGISSGTSIPSKALHMPTTKDMMLRTSSKQVLGSDADSSRQVQLALLPNTFYCGSVPGQAMVATTEGTIRVELPPPTVGINISKQPQIPNPISKPPSISSSISSSSGGIFTFPSKSLPPLTSISSQVPPPPVYSSMMPSSVHYQGSSSKHLSPTYATAVSSLQSWHLSPTPQARPTPSIKIQNRGHGNSSIPEAPEGEHHASDLPDAQRQLSVGDSESTQKSPGGNLHQPPPHHHLHPPKHTKATISARHQPTSTLPSYFTRGSIIQLANSVLKRVEDLTTDDFVQSAGSTDGLKIDSSTVLRIDEEPQRGLALLGFLVGEHKAQVTVEAPFEHPFFVFGQGWSAVRPELSMKCYGLQCHALAVGDVCVSLTVIENGKQGLKEDSGLDKQLVRVQIEGLSSPELKRRRIDDKLVQFAPSEHHPGGPTLVQGLGQGLGQSRASHSPASPSHPTNQLAPSGGGPCKVEDRGIDKNFNIVAVDKVPEMSQERQVRIPKRRWSDPIRASQEVGDKQVEQQDVALETLGKVQQQQ